MGGQFILLILFCGLCILIVDNDTKSNEYRDRHYQFRSTFRKVFYVWNKTEDKAGWCVYLFVWPYMDKHYLFRYDYNVRSQQHNMHFYPSIAVPLFTRCYRSINVAQAQRIFRTMEGMDVFKSPGGIPTRFGSYNKIEIF
jgi:alpha,alpha-trehalase